MGQTTTIIILAVTASIFAFGFIYLTRKEIKKMEGRNYKKLKGEKLLMENLK